MKNLNILVTSAGGDIGANIIRILREQTEFQCNVFGADIKEHIFAEKMLDGFFTTYRTFEDDYIVHIKQIVKDCGIDLIIPASEIDIIFFVEHRSDFANTEILINSADVVNTFLDKYLTFITLKDLNVPVPETEKLNSKNWKHGYPAVIKAARTVTSKSIQTVQSEEKFAEACASIRNTQDYIVQKHIGSAEEEFTTAVYRSGETFRTITFKRQLTGGMTGYAEIYKSEQLHETSRKIAEAYNLNGCINIQSRKHNGRHYVFEINPRISSTVYIRHRFNFSDLLWWISSLCGLKGSETEAEIPDKGTAVLGYTYEFFYED